MSYILNAVPGPRRASKGWSICLGYTRLWFCSLFLLFPRPWVLVLVPRTTWPPEHQISPWQPFAPLLRPVKKKQTNSKFIFLKKRLTYGETIFDPQHHTVPQFPPLGAAIDHTWTARVDFTSRWILRSNATHRHFWVSHSEWLAAWDAAQLATGHRTGYTHHKE